MENNKVFAQGIFFEKPSDIVKEKAPWIKGKISIKVPDLIPFLEKHQNNAGYVNIDMKLSEKTGKIYLELNNWKPKVNVEQDNQEKLNNMVKEPIIDPLTGEDVSEQHF